MGIQRVTRWFALATVAIVGGCTEHERQDEAPDTLASTAPATVLYPPDPCVLSSETLQVVVVADGADGRRRLTLDGRSLDVRRLRLGWTLEGSSQQVQPPSSPSDGSSEGAGRLFPGRVAAGTPVLVATTSLEPGEHRVEASQRHVRVFVRPSARGAATPADWPVFHLHPPPMSPGRPVACFVCHEIVETPSGSVLRRPQMPDPCFSCHPADDFELIHTHRVDVLTACHMCHDPHGSTRPLLLRDDPKLLCSACHE